MLFMTWIKLRRLLMKMTNFHFRLDVPSRCDKTSTATGFRGYFQCHECCIYCFVIQILSEPDKLNCWCSVFKVRFEAWLHQLLLAIPGQMKTKIQYCLKLIYLQNERYTSEGKKHYTVFEWLVEFNIYFGSCFLFTTKKTEIQQNF